MNFKFDDLPKIDLKKNKYRISLVKGLDFSMATVFSQACFSVTLKFIEILDVLGLCRFLTICDNMPYARCLKDGVCSEIINSYDVISVCYGFKGTMFKRATMNPLSSIAMVLILYA